VDKERTDTLLTIHSASKMLEHMQDSQHSSTNPRRISHVIKLISVSNVLKVGAA